MNTTNLENMKKVLYFFGGVAVTLLLLALTELPSNWSKRSDMILIDGWFGIWLVLLLGSLVPALTLCMSADWRIVPAQLRLNTIFGYFAVAWTALLAFSIRLTIHLPNLFHYVVFGLGIILAAAYLIARRRTNRVEELFP